MSQLTDTPLRILVIDDDEVDRMTVRRALKTPDRSFSVEEAEDASSALKTLNQSAFDCVILDYRMPGTDGLALLKQIRILGISVPVIMLTGQGDERLVVEIMKAGATDYLSKSGVSPENLTLSIRNAIRVQRAEQALRESESRFRTMADSAPVLLWMSDTNGGRLFFNQSWLQFTGHTSEQEVGNGWQTEIHADDLDRCLTFYKQHFETRRPFEIEYRLRRNDGQYRWVLESATPRLTSDGNFIGFIGSCIDINERKQIASQQQFLVEATQRLYASLNTSVILTNLANLVIPYLADWCTVDTIEPDNKITRVAVATADQTKNETLPPLQRSYTLATNQQHGLSAAIRNSETALYAEIPSELRANLDEGHRTLVELFGVTSLMMVPLIVRGRVLGVVTFASTKADHHYGQADLAFAQDVAQRTAIAVDNAQLYREAQEAIQLREVFLSVASHELKTPLTSLMANAQLFLKRAARDNNLNERDSRTLNTIFEQAIRLNKLIGTLLDISRLENGKLSIQQEPMDLAALARRLVDESQIALERHTIEFQDFPGALPLLGDELRLEQVIQNLLQNAIKYSPKGGVVRVEVGADEGRAFISVKDQGIGIPQESFSHLFDRFFRAPNADERNISGLGLGLYVVKEIIALHGGTIDVSSMEGQGSTFTVKLPLHVVVSEPV